MHIRKNTGMSTVEQMSGGRRIRLSKVVIRSDDMTQEIAQLFQDRVELEALLLNEKAETMPDGQARDGVLHKARQMSTASEIVNMWLSSPGLRSPR